jgi:putative DNA primase/helicase
LSGPIKAPVWKEEDRYPNSEARAAACGVFGYLDELTPEAIGAGTDQFEKIPFLRFDDDALYLFKEWRSDLEHKLRSDEIVPALESHLAKYRKLVPSLALINHLADRGTGQITETALLRALSFSEYLETHARRAYGAGSEVETSAAKAILKHIRKGDLQDGFTGRDVHVRGWAGLSDRAHVQAGLDLLCDLDWLFAGKRETGGRPSIAFRINPRAFQ